MKIQIRIRAGARNMVAAILMLFCLVSYDPACPQEFAERILINFLRYPVSGPHPCDPETGY